MLRAMGEIKQGDVIVAQTVGADSGRGLKKGLSERLFLLSALMSCSSSLFPANWQLDPKTQSNRVPSLRCDYGTDNWLMSFYNLRSC